MTYHIFKLYCS